MLKRRSRRDSRVERERERERVREAAGADKRLIRVETFGVLRMYPPYGTIPALTASRARQSLGNLTGPETQYRELQFNSFSLSSKKHRVLDFIMPTSSPGNDLISRRDQEPGRARSPVNLHTVYSNTKTTAPCLCARNRMYPTIGLRTSASHPITTSCRSPNNISLSHLTDKERILLHLHTPHLLSTVLFPHSSHPIPSCRLLHSAHIHTSLPNPSIHPSTPPIKYLLRNLLSSASDPPPLNHQRPRAKPKPRHKLQRSKLHGPSPIFVGKRPPKPDTANQRATNCALWGLLWGSWRGAKPYQNARYKRAKAALSFSRMPD